MLAEMTRPAAATAVSKRFGRFKDEDEKAVRAAGVKKDPMLERLMDEWRAAQWGAYVDRYAERVELPLEVRCTAREVETFSLALTELRHEKDFRNKAGGFLNALVRNGTDESYVIHTRHLDVKINGIVPHDGKEIIVEGDIGDRIGEYMESGYIVVRGNAGNATGLFMLGGGITIEGNAGGELGRYMEGGVIIVGGNAGNGAGYSMSGGLMMIGGDAGGAFCEGMSGGEARVLGGIKNFGFTHLGDIYHKGRLLDKGCVKVVECIIHI